MPSLPCRFPLATSPAPAYLSPHSFSPSRFIFLPPLRVQPALVAFESGIKEKVALVCTMELASQRSPADRSLAFTDIAAATRLPLDQVCVCVCLCLASWVWVYHRC